MDIAAHAARIYFAGMMFIGVLYACQRTFMALGRTKLSLLGAMMRKPRDPASPLASSFPGSGMGRTACSGRNPSRTLWEPPSYS